MTNCRKDSDNMARISWRVTMTSRGESSSIDCVASGGGGGGGG